MKPIEVDAALGVRNDLSPERFKVGDLVTGDNIEIDETGKVYRRLGMVEAVAGAAHSLWSGPGGCFAVLGGQLGSFDGTTHTPMTAVTDVVCYEQVIDRVFWSDGVTTGTIRGGVSSQAGVLPPTISAASTLGNLRPGKYLFTATYLRDDDHESGAPVFQMIDVKANEGVVFTVPNSPNPRVVGKRIYMSAWNGDLPYLVATLTNSETTATVADLPSLTLPVRTAQLMPTPAGQVLGVYKGRLYVAKNNVLWYSRPYEFELFDLRNDYLMFASRVNTFAPVSDGVFLGTDSEIVFLQGDAPEQFNVIPKAGYGSVLGTTKRVPNYYVGPEGVPGNPVMFTSKRGVCTGFDGGELKNLTGGRYILPEGVSAGASLLKVRGGTPQFLTTLF